MRELAYQKIFANRKRRVRGLWKRNGWFYPPGPATDPTGAAEGMEKVLRGGAFVYGPQRTRCAFRGRNLPGFENFYVGFRILLEN